MLHLLRLDSDPPFILPELVGCFRRTPERPNSLRCLVYDGDMQIAFMALDLQPDFFLYELYVIPSRRDHGVGAWMLDELEIIAQAALRDRIYVRPIPLDGGDPERLKRWYIQHGYTASGKYADALEKALN